MGTIEFTDSNYADQISARIAAVRADLKRVGRKTDIEKEQLDAEFFNDYFDNYDRVFEIRRYVKLVFTIHEFAGLLRNLDKLEASHKDLYI